jgi:PAS domain S-box-containing protein
MSPFALLPFIPPLILAALIPYIWRHRQTPGARSLVVLFLALIEWGLAYALEVLPGVDLSTKFFCVSVKYIGIAAVPVAWLAFALEYSSRQKWLTRRNIVLLSCIPAITVILALTNFGELMRQPVTLVQAGPFMALDFSFGLWFWVHAAYSYILILLGTIFIFQMYRRSTGLYRRQAFALLLAAIVPWISNALFIFGISPIPYLDLTSFAFTVTALVWLWALFRFRLLDVAPVARDAVFDSMTDVVLVLDLGNRMVDLNPAAQKVIGLTAAEAIGQPVERILANWSDLVERYRNLAEVREEIAIAAQDGTGQRYFDLRITPIADRQDHLIGRLIVLRDITEGRLVEALSDSEKHMRHRATQLQTVAEVARAITSEQNLAELLPLVARLIGERFGFYHVAIFLLDRGGEHAVLQAASSEGGQYLLTQGHRLRVGQEGIVGYVAGRGMARTVIDVSQDTEFVSSPHLPLTRSETALPLRVRDQVIGVLDVQSAQVAAFTEEDVALLATLADQVATAIENARSFERLTTLAEENHQLFERSEKAVQDLDALTRRLTTEGWDKYFTGQRGELVAEDVLAEPITVAGELSGAVEALEDTPSTNTVHTPRVLTVPILLRGEEIGAIDLEPSKSNQAWDQEHLAIVTSVAQRVGLALDNARLFEQTQTALSETEQLYDIGLRINAAATLEDVLQAAIAPSIISGASSAGLWVLDLNEAGQPTEMEFEASWVREGPPPLPLGTRFHAADFPSSKLWLNETGQPTFIGDIAHDPRVDPQMLVTFQRVNIAATAFIPLVIGQRWVGLGIVSWREPYDVTPSEHRMYQSIASQVAIAIENRRLFEQAQQRNAELATLNQIISSASATLDLRLLLDMVLSQTLQVFGFDGGLITMYNETRQKLERIVRTGLPGEIPPDPAEGLENSLCAYVFNSKQPLVIEDFRQGGPIDISGEIEAGYYSYIGVPLEAKGRMLGTWCGFRKVAGPFGKNTLTMLQAIGLQVGFAIENARLFEQIQQDAERERTINRISGRIRGARSVDEVLAVATQELRLATQASRSVVDIAPHTAKPAASGNGSAASNQGATE